MATAPVEVVRGGREEAKEAKDAKDPKDAKDAKAPETAESAESNPAPAKSAGAWKAWLPLIVTVATMPLLAFATTRFVLLPRMQRALGQASLPAAAEAVTETPASDAKPAASAAPQGKTKILVPMNKMLVNVSGTMGTRYLMTSITLVGNTPDFKSRIEDNRDQLMDLATGTLGSKTIADLEKPGVRNVIRSELLSVINNALGAPLVQEIYITELAIQ
jgi:flagellar FliL protein